MFRVHVPSAQQHGDENFSPERAVSTPSIGLIGIFSFVLRISVNLVSLCLPLIYISCLTLGSQRILSIDTSAFQTVQTRETISSNGSNNSSTDDVERFIVFCFKWVITCNFLSQLKKEMLESFCQEKWTWMICIWASRKNRFHLNFLHAIHVNLSFLIIVFRNNIVGWTRKVLRFVLCYLYSIYCYRHLMSLFYTLYSRDL